MIYEIIIYSFVSFLILFLTAKISFKLKLTDIPNKRKIHSAPTPYTGGVAICILLLISISLLDISSNTLNLIFSMAFLISFVGFVDDRYNLSAGSKLCLQIIPIFFLIILENLYLTSLGDYGQFSLKLGTLGIPFSLFCILFLINSFNYLDGIDGALGFVSVSVLIILYFLTPNIDLRLFFIIALIPIIFFLCFNFSILGLPKMFLGDSGSLPIGFVISFVLIYMANQNHAHHLLLAWSIVIFVYEFLSINIIRLSNNKSLFTAGNDHLHHMLYKKSKSIFIVNFFLVFLNSILFLIGYFSFYLINSEVSAALFIIFFLIFLFFRNKYS